VSPLTSRSERWPTPEDHPCLPESPYGTAKLCAEAYGGTFSRQAGLEFVALRYANVYGPRQDPHGEAGVVAIFATRLVHGEAVVINGDGTQARDYVHVHDVVRVTSGVDGPADRRNLQPPIAFMKFLWKCRPTTGSLQGRRTAERSA
jgi:nucleoside-diphosphate-sugar epimerase